MRGGSFPGRTFLDQLQVEQPGKFFGLIFHCFALAKDLGDHR
jgi:hypothetical protein